MCIAKVCCNGRLPHCFVFLFIAYSMTLSISQSVYRHLMSADDYLERKYTEAVVPPLKCLERLRETAKELSVKPVFWRGVERGTFSVSAKCLTACWNSMFRSHVKNNEISPK